MLGIYMCDCFLGTHIQHVRLGLKRSYTIVDYYCWLIWCERKILFWLKIYDRLRPSEQAESLYPVLSLKLSVTLPYPHVFFRIITLSSCVTANCAITKSVLRIFDTVHDGLTSTVDQCGKMVNMVKLKYR